MNPIGTGLGPPTAHCIGYARVSRGEGSAHLRFHHPNGRLPGVLRAHAGDMCY